MLRQLTVTAMSIEKLNACSVTSYIRLPRVCTENILRNKEVVKHSVPDREAKSVSRSSSKQEHTQDVALGHSLRKEVGASGCLAASKRRQVQRKHIYISADLTMFLQGAQPPAVGMTTGKFCDPPSKSLLSKNKTGVLMGAGRLNNCA